MVTVHKDTLKQKVDTLIQENQIITLDKNSTDSFQKHIQETIHKCNKIIDKKQHKHQVQIKLTAPRLNALIKAHKDVKPIRPVIYNAQAPSYKLASYPNKGLNQLINLPYT